MSGGSVYATSAELYEFTPDQGPLYARLIVTASDQEQYIAFVQNYEYEETRGPMGISAGYYRFMTTHLVYSFTLDDGVSIDIDPVWTDWYYLSNDIHYSQGEREEYHH